MTTVVAVSDLHLDVRTTGVRRFDEVARTLRQAKGEAIRRKVDLFICAGDLGDPDSGSIVYRLLALCLETAFDLDRAGIPHLWVKGNHDGKSGESLFTPIAALADGVVSNARVCEEPAYWGGEEYDVLALPHSEYDPAQFVREFAGWKEESKSEVPTLVVSHLFPIPGIEPGEETSEMPRGGPRPLPCEELARIPGRVVVLSGHYHRRQVYQPSVKGCPPVYVIGSIATLSYGEESNGDPGFLVVRF